MPDETPVTDERTPEPELVTEPETEIAGRVEIEAAVMADEAQRRAWLESIGAFLLAQRSARRGHPNYAVQSAIDQALIAAAERIERILRGDISMPARRVRPDGDHGLLLP